MSTDRRLVLGGTIAGSDSAGRSFDLLCEGDRVIVNTQNVRAALAALSSFRATALHFGFRPSATEHSWFTRNLGAFQFDFQVGGHPVARAGAGARVTWLGRAVTRLPVELRLRPLLAAIFKAF